MAVLDFLSPTIKRKTEKYMFYNHFLEEEIGCSCLDNSFVLPYVSGKGEGCVVDKNGVFQENTTLNSSFSEGGYKFEEKEVKYINKNAIFIGTIYSVFGHVITDDLKKIWFLNTEKAKRLLADGADIVYLSWHGQDLKPYVGHILSLAGVPFENAICIDCITKYNRVFIPDNSLVSNDNILYYTKEFKLTIDSILQHIPADNVMRADKIYLSRTSLKSWRDYGENAVEKVFRENGYSIIHPEELSFENQISLYRNTKEIVASEGSISHMFLFCKPHTKVVILKKANYINNYQMMINAFANIDAIFVDANHTVNFVNSWVGPFYMAVTKYVSKFLGIRKYDNFFLKLDYYVYLLRFLKYRIL